MGFDFGQSADAERDAQLRHDILFALYHAQGTSPTGGMSGDALLGKKLNANYGFEKVSHFLRLCRDLVNAGLATQKDLGKHRQNQNVEPSHVLYKITFKGTQLIEETIPPIPGIADGRAAIE
jgi:hypothetical protein